MKVYINKYKDNWISPYTILEKIYFWREIDYDEPVIDKLSSILLPFCEFYHWIANKVNRKIDYVKIDGWDTWSMDTTLSRIILPMLKQLQATKHGAPSVHDDDVPLALKSTMAPPKVDEWDTDDNHFRRWDYVLDEMIFALEEFHAYAGIRDKSSLKNILNNLTFKNEAVILKDLDPDNEFSRNAKIIFSLKKAMHPRTFGDNFAPGVAATVATGVLIFPKIFTMYFVPNTKFLYKIFEYKFN